AGDAGRSGATEPSYASAGLREHQRTRLPGTSLIVYFDTSALLPLVVHDPSSRLCRRLWNEADDRVTCDGAYVELAGILALGEEGGQLTAEGHEQAWMNVTRMWPTLDVVHMVPDLVVAAARYARPRHLTGAAAVHYAAV